MKECDLVRLALAALLLCSPACSMSVAELTLPLPPWAFAPLASGTVLLAFCLAYPLADHVDPAGEGANWPYVYPSAAINYSPSGNVGAFVLSVGSVAMSWALALRHAENAARLGSESAALNAGASCVALVGLVVFPLGVVAVPWHEYPRTHMGFAYSTFYAGALYLVLQTYLDHQRPQLVPAHVRHVRLGLVAAGVLCMLAYWLGFGLVGTRRPGSTSSTAAEALLECACGILVLLFVATFALSQLHLSVRVAVALGGGEQGEQAPLADKGGKRTSYDALAREE